MTRPVPKATRAEVGLLVGIAVLASVAFSPVGQDVTFAGVSLIAWLLWFTMITAPLVGLVIALRSRTED